MCDEKRPLDERKGDIRVVEVVQLEWTDLDGTEVKITDFKPIKVVDGKIVE